MSINKKGNSAVHRGPFIADGRINDSCLDNGDYVMVGTVCVPLMNQHLQNVQSSSLSSSARCNSSIESCSKCKSMSDPVPSSLPNTQPRKTQIHRRTRVDIISENSSVVTCSAYNSSSGSENKGLSHTKKLPATNFTSHHDEYSLPSEFGKKRFASPSWPHSRQGNLNYSPASGKLDCSVSFPKFDICRWRGRNYALSVASLLSENKERCTKTQEGLTEQMILRPGMVLLKRYISLDEQVEIMKTCRELGLGPGGFYQPGYENGAKLRLQMMCLGLDWDPQTSKYGKKRSIDGSEPPGIPGKFSMLVNGAIQEAHCLIKKETRLSDVEDILPSMNPNICIVNFYSTNGRLGLHQDRDESKESLQKGLPVVSISIGDSAEFLYGDHQNVERAEKVVLESGDVLIFGGESRHVFHGVSAIIPNSAPKELLKHTRLRRGRLNLTFRQF